MAKQTLAQRVATKLLSSGKVTEEMLWRPAAHANVHHITEDEELTFNPNAKARRAVRQNVRSMKPYSIFVLCWYSRDVDLLSVPNAKWQDREMGGRDIVRLIAETVVMANLLILTQDEEEYDEDDAAELEEATSAA